MRISDWSSDVCSSDLGLLFDRTQAHQHGARGDAVVDVVHDLGHPAAGLRGQRRLAHRLHHAVPGAALSGRGIGDDHRLEALDRDRKSVVWGKSVSVRVDLGGRSSIKKITY